MNHKIYYEIYRSVYDNPHRATSYLTQFNFFQMIFSNVLLKINSGAVLKVSRPALFAVRSGLIETMTLQSPR
jgi:hypothetical protein